MNSNENLNENLNSTESLPNLNSEKIKLISNSDIYWDKYWSKIDKAKNFIFVITYDIDNKMIANLTLRKLMDAQERGVQVVLIVEHLNFYMKHSLYKQLKNSGVIIIKPNPVQKIFSHMRNLNTKKFFNRCHQKVTLIDNDLFLGSINIGEEYSHYKYGTYNFVDLNIYVKNTICFKRVLTFFKELIEDNKEQIQKGGRKEKLEAIYNKYLIENPEEINENIIRDNYKNDNSYEQFLEEKPPVKSEIQDNLYDLLDSSKESITIVQPYYNNMQRIEDILVRAIKRGVKVKIITAEKRDQTAYRYQYNNDLFEHLLKNGIEVYEYLDKFLHSKAYYVDNKIISMGSLNNDRTSFILNNEANYLIKKNDKNKQFFNDFDSYIVNLEDNCRRVQLGTYRNPFRYAYSYWWYFFLWCMEVTVPNRKRKYKDY